jgi:hypothetical protein
MSDPKLRRPPPRRGLILGAALLAASTPSWAIFGVWRRAARRTVFVAGATTAAVVGTEAAAATAATANANAAAANQAAAARSAADASAAAAQQAQAAATQAQTNATQANSSQEKLRELQSLYDQKLISQSDYEAAKKKILNQLTQ